MNTDDVDESIALGRVREHLIAFKIQSERVLNTADLENGFGEETERQMNILVNHYQPALIESLKAFEQLEIEAVEQFNKHAADFAVRIGILLTLLSLTSIGLTIFMSLWLAKRFILPLKVLTENISLSPEEGMNTPVYINTNDEMGALARALNHMKAQVNASRKQLEQYARTLEAQVEARTRELQLLAITDSLTGAYNRGHFFRLARQSFAEARRLKHPFSIVLIDADHFKTVNDQYGHAVGDRVLKRIVQTIKSQIRQIDILGRYGGEEFALVLPNANLDEAMHIIKRIAASLRDTKFESGGRQFCITISGGISEHDPANTNETLEDLMLKADKALYAAKDMGRDLIIAYTSTSTQQGDAMPTLEYSSAELMIVNAARLLRDGDVVFVGVGQPNLACNLAKRTHAPNLVMIYEAGVIGAEPARLPLSIGDPTLVSGSLSVVSMYDIFANYLQRGNVDVGFMGGAQIDKYGNINATVIGAYEKPKVRLPGSGGSQEIAAWANRCYIMTPHQKRRFPERCDFRTSVGALDGGGERQRIGLRGNGMEAVVTDIGILEPDETGELILTALHPGKTVEEAKANTGWDLKIAAHVRTTNPVTEKELRILREELDPTGIYLKGGG